MATVFSIGYLEHFLPLYDHWASLVWYDSPDKIRRLQGMSMEQLTGAVSEYSLNV